MTLIRGGPAGPDGLGGAYSNTVESDRAALWSALGGRQGVLRGFVHSGVSGQMSLSFTAGAALVDERDASGNAGTLFRGYHVWSDTATVVQFGPASPSARNDAVVAAFVDTEDGPVGTGGLDVGPHLVVIPGVSGTSTPRTDTQITAWLGRGGWIRLLDVPIASSDVQINLAGITDRKTSAGRTQFVRKRTDEALLSSTALQSDDELSFDVVAGRVYEFTVTLFCAANSTGANGDIVVGFSFPGGGTLDFAGTGPHNTDLSTGSNSNAEWIARRGATSGTTVIPYGLSQSPSSEIMIVLRGTHVCATDGTVTLQWAQLTSSSNGVKVLGGSYLKADRVV